MRRRVELETKMMPRESNPSERSLLARSRFRRYKWNFILLALLVFLTCGYFQNTRPGWNVNSQFALTCAIVEHQTLSIDAYQKQPEFMTNDKAFFNGHFYTDKSPVTPFLGVPAFFVYSEISKILDHQIDYNSARYWTTWWSIGLCAAAMTFVLAKLLKRHGLSSNPAAALAGLWFLSTPLLGYAILFFNYLPACFFAVGGFGLIESILTDIGKRRRAEQASKELAKAERYDVVYTVWPAWARLLIGGFLIGLATWTLPTLGLLALILTTALLFCWPPKFWIHLWPWALGGILGFSGNFIYNYAIFGSPFTSPYRYEFDPNFQSSMKQGLMGATWPDPLVLWLITFSRFRGLFTLFPPTLLAFIGLLIGIRWRRFRRVELISLIFSLGLLLYNSGYFMWWGGWAYAPRHLIPALPFLALGLTPLIRRPDRPRMRAIFLPLLICTMIYSAALNISVVSLDPQFPPGLSEEALRDPHSVTAWPHPYFDMLNYVREGQTDPNWGTALGLRGIASLIPLAAIWAMGLSVMLWQKRTTPSGSIKT